MKAKWATGQVTCIRRKGQKPIYRPEKVTVDTDKYFATVKKATVKKVKGDD